MRQRHSLRFRVALAFAALGATLGLLFAAGIWFATHDVSQRLMDETLAAELADYMARRARNPHSLPPATASLNGYLIRPGETAADLPADLAGLPAGRHEITIGDTSYRVAIADRDGERFVLLFNETRQQRRERRFLAWLIGGATLMTLLAALGGQWLAGLGIAPVTELANAVSRADPENPPRLARSAGPGDEIDELAQAFDRYLARLAAFIERERNFAADASHELRTPLAAIRGAAEILADDLGLNDAQSARIGRILRATEEMGELISALLLLSREDRAPVEAPCDAGRIAHDCVERYRSLAEKQDTRLALSLAADAIMLPVPTAYFAIIIANLVHNAVAHTRNGTVSIRLAPHELVVGDSGNGISAADIAHVFERHFRGNESTGAGIGLSLVKRICERLDWRVGLDSHPVEGTTVTVRFGP